MPDRDIHSIRQCHARLRPYTTMSRQAAATNPSPGQGDLRTNRTMGCSRYTAACSMVSRPPSVPRNVAPPAQSTPAPTAACTGASAAPWQPLSSSAQRLRRARAACDPAIALYDDVAWLLEWFGQDILSVAGPAYAQRSLLYDFMTAELLARVALCPHRLEPVPRTLKKGRQEFLAEARGRSVLLLPRQVSSACCCILTRRASEGSASEPALARRKIGEI